MNVGDINYCETTRNVDNMLMQFKNDRDRLVSLIDDDIDMLVKLLWTPKSPVCVDNKCIFNMGNTLKSKTLEERILGKIPTNESVANFYLCSQCRNMKRLFDSAKHKIGTPFYIECGSSVGEQLILKEDKINKLFVIPESPPAAVSRALINPYITQLERCGAGCKSSGPCQVKDYSKVQYIGLDPYTNNLLINWYLTSKLEQLGIPNLIKMHIGFICCNQGYSLYEYPDIGRLRHLQEYPQFLEQEGKPSPTAKRDDKMTVSNDTAKGIIMQLFAVLHALKTFDFSHGGPSSRTILMEDKVCSYMYDGFHVESPITIKLCDLQHAGITVGNSRIYNKSVIAEEALLKTTFKPIITTVTVDAFTFPHDKIEELSNSERVTIYRLRDPRKYLQEAVMFMYIKHLGLPIYQSSFDVYALMISLMSERSFYRAVLDDELMYLLWRSMWLPEEFEIIQDKMDKLHNEPDPVTRVDKILRILAGFGLRCDMINHGWNLIKKW